MAKMKMPSGVFTEEQNGLRVKVINSMESRADAIPIFNRSLLSLERVLNSSPSIPDKPQVSDIIGFTGNLKAVVPAGFLLLHNDLLSLRGGGISSESAESDSSGGGFLSTMENILTIAGAAAIAVAIGKNVFAGSEESSFHLQKLIDELNAKLTADELYDDSGVRTAQKIGIIAYLAAYYGSQAAAMAVDNVAGGVADAVVGFGTKLIKGLCGEPTEKTYAKIQTLIDGLIDKQTVDDLLESKEVMGAMNLGFAAYTIAYFGSQSLAIAADNVAGGLGDAIVGFGTKIFGALFGKPAEKTTSKIQTLVDGLIDKQTVDELLKSKEVTDAVNSGFISYINIYFESQNKAVKSKGFFERLGEAPSNLAKGILGGLFNLVTGKDVNTPSALKSIIDSINSNDFINDETTQRVAHSAAREGIRNYIRAYYDTWADVTSDKTQITNNSFAQKAANWWNGLWKDDEVPQFVPRLKEITDTFSDEDMPSESQLRALKKESLLKGAEAVLETQLNLFKDQLERDSSYYTTYGDSSNTFSKMFDANASLKISMSNEEITNATLEGVSILNKISSTLDLLSQAVANSTNGSSGPIIINNESTPASDDLSFSIPG